MRVNDIINALILFVFVGIALWWGFGQRTKKLRYKDNFEAEAKYRDQERQISQNEIKDLYKIAEDLQKKLAIKPKQIERIIQGEIKYIDTGSTRVIFRPSDTVLVYPDSLYGKIEKSCYSLSYSIYEGIFRHSLNYHDSLDVLLYRERPHKFLFIKYGRWRHKATIYSNCADSTYKVFNNISVLR